MTTPLQNEPLSALTHLIGAVLSIVGLVLLIVSAAQVGTALHIVTFTIFGVTMFLLYLMSALYHSVCRDRFPKARRALQVLDHTAVYMLIAGTYTPVTLIVLPPGWGWSLFGLTWAIALLGAVIKIGQIQIPTWGSVALYLAMGWLVVIAGVPLVSALPSGGFFWLVVGGLCYTVGAVFYVLDTRVPRTRWFGMHEIFHVFVMLGSFAHFWMLMRYVVHMQ